MARTEHINGTTNPRQQRAQWRAVVERFHLSRESADACKLSSGPDIYSIL
jgi:hypothetical protein